MVTVGNPINRHTHMLDLPPPSSSVLCRLEGGPLLNDDDCCGQVYPMYMYIYIYMYKYIYMPIVGIRRGIVTLPHTHSHTHTYIYMCIYICVYIYIYLFIYASCMDPVTRELCFLDH